MSGPVSDLRLLSIGSQSSEAQARTDGGLSIDVFLYLQRLEGFYKSIFLGSGISNAVQLQVSSSHPIQDHICLFSMNLRNVQCVLDPNTTLKDARTVMRFLQKRPRIFRSRARFIDQDLQAGVLGPFALV